MQPQRFFARGRWERIRGQQKQSKICRTALKRANKDKSALKIPTGSLRAELKITTFSDWCASQCSKTLAALKWEIMMDWNRVEGNWKQVKGKVKEKWGKLTDDELDKMNGRREQLEGKIQERYGIAKDQTKKDVDDWFNSMKW
jgi:uncharacterized protein YjbJ (UPF0337 family)